MGKNKKGKLIVIDGSDGSGKATQAKLLIDHLKKEGRIVKMLDFPQYGRPSAYFVENYLNGEYGGVDKVTARAASLFYALDRYDAKQRIIKKLKEGKVIISNRYVSSNAGHQGGKIKNRRERDKFLDWLYSVEYEILGLPRPDINIYLHVPWKIGQSLVERKGERKYIKGGKKDIHERDKEHLKNAQEAYLYLVEKEKNWLKIDCIKRGKLMTRDEIHDKIWEVVRKLL